MLGAYSLTFGTLIPQLSRPTNTPDSKVHGANMGPTWVLSAPDGHHVGPMNLAIRVNSLKMGTAPAGQPTVYKANSSKIVVARGYSAYSNFIMKLFYIKRHLSTLKEWFWSDG